MMHNVIFIEDYKRMDKARQHEYKMQTDREYRERMVKIKSSLEKINRLMLELKRQHRDN